MKSKRIQSHIIIVWCLLALLIACSSQTVSVTDENLTVANNYGIPEVGLSLQYPDDFVLKEWESDNGAGDRLLLGGCEKLLENVEHDVIVT